MCHSLRKRLKNKGAAASYTTALPYILGYPYQMLSGPRVHLLLPWHGHYRDKLEKPLLGENITPHHHPLCTREVWVVRESFPCEREGGQHRKITAEARSLASFKHQ